MQGGQTYEFTARIRTENVPVPRRCAVTRILWRGADGGSVLCDKPGIAGPGRVAEASRRAVAEPEYPVDVGPVIAGSWSTVRGVYRAPADATAAVVELSLRWAVDARVDFAQVELRAITPPPARLARLATAHFRPEKGTTAAEKCVQFVPLVEQAARERADLLVLPETLTYYQAGSFEDAAEPIPGPSTEFFGALARKHNMYIVAGLVEREGHLIYNTAALLDPQGGLLGKYRKVTLPRGEIDGGITPGTEFPVFETRFGKLGMMICYDGAHSSIIPCHQSSIELVAFLWTHFHSSIHVDVFISFVFICVHLLYFPWCGHGRTRRLFPGSSPSALQRRCRSDCLACLGMQPAAGAGSCMREPRLSGRQHLHGLLLAMGDEQHLGPRR